MTKLSKQQELEIVEKYKTIKSCTKIGHDYGVCTTTISKILKKYNVEVINNPSHITDEQLIQEYTINKLSIAQIGYKYNTDRNKAAKRLKKLGYTVVNE